MNVAIVIAGGNGRRMGYDIPKQFISVYDKPILFYTLEAFEKNALIDAIVVVSVAGWEEAVKAYAKQFGITKLQRVVLGGSPGRNR